MSDISKNLIILGPQGSGKGTQAKLLEEKFGYLVLGAGDILREIAKQDTELGRLVNQTINVEGRLVEPDLIARVMREKLLKTPADQPVIIDGFPRTSRQYELMKEFWPRIGRGDLILLFIELTGEEAVNRLGKRFTCENCGAVYTGDQGQCQKCGGKLFQREDDKPEAVRMRLQLFNQETLPMIKEIKKESRVIRINGAPSIEEVHNEIVKKLGLDK